MQMRPEIQLASMLKAMRDVVIPALPAENGLAVEQARLVVGMLELMRFQMPRQFGFDRDELLRLLSTASDLGGMQISDGDIGVAVEALGAVAQPAAELLARCDLDPSRLPAAIGELRRALCALVDVASASEDIASRERIDRAIFSLTAEQLLRDRALMKPQGWEADPGAVPNIDTLLGTA